ncbi:putative external alternative NAD(P)H-ubiquinone oxidoreductase [Babesia sp. Xinjiang]|uniref:putative external alternative NAD(P)H-ubiquinone oxidoreductase n=1 Tax=Babesia sp. Xinjiang TaxID=462227 RepID=UPI000A252207|nr:putative external alternative NAD(P)H-ubiquinone oxidoreductase [Babesia sp. Xinjiang]ORM41229.1 putative external alternative NAD(P)H-ubiquinone oxidoreductase [Babesia sp. Xinjiang]
MKGEGSVGYNAKNDPLLPGYTRPQNSEERTFPVESLENKQTDASTHDYKDESLYKTTGCYFMEKGLWRQALREFHCRLFLLDKDTQDYETTINLIREVRHNLLSEVMPIPVHFKEMLFVRNLEEKWTTWTSQMGYTEQLRNFNNTESTVGYHSNTMVAKIALKQGSLLMRLQPFAAAPWKIDMKDSQKIDSTDYSNCFHCLCTIIQTTGLYHDNTTLVACPCKPYECLYTFCSEECFLRNGAVHTVECGYLVKLKSFALTMLNEALVLLVVRTLIRCSLTRNNPNNRAINNSEKAPNGDNDDVLQQILDFKVDYSVLEASHKKVIEDIKTFAHFLMNELGVKFCIYLTHRELVHLIVVLWTKSLALTPSVYVESESVKLGGVAFTPSLLHLQQSSAPTTSVYLDRKGKICIRSIYTMEPGTRLYMNTAMDKYLPLHNQYAEFWSVGLLLSSKVAEVPSTNDNRGISALRCGMCITSYCHVERVEMASEMRNEGSDTSNKYIWACENGCAVNQDDLNMLQKKAEDIIKRVHRLHSSGQHLTAKKILESFVLRWAGVLHINHYLLYNAHVLLAGMKMNKAGSNIRGALNHLTIAVLMAEEMMPLICHEKAHLYSRLADLMGQLVMTARVNRKEDVQLKQMTIEAAYTALWNWTLIAGADSNESITHMQKCRSLAFQMNLHVPRLSKGFVINVPGKYLEVFKLVTGKCVIPSIINFSTTGNLTDIPTDNVATVAFMAAQSGMLTDAVLEVLMSIESRGIMHLGTGLSMLGIAASNGNVDLVKAITDFISTKVAKAFDFLAKNDNTVDAELTVVNLILSTVGGNELGITPLMAMASVPVDNDTQALKNEIIISRLMLECAEKCDEIIAKHRGEINIKLGSFKWLMTSGVTVKTLLLDARTHDFLKGQTILHYAASQGKRNLVQYLARVSRNVNQTNLEGATPLHLAALGGHIEVCETLLSFGAKHNIPLNTGELALHLAIYALHDRTVRLLVEQYVKHTPNEDTSLRNVWVSQTQKRGPSIWHALVSGIYRPSTSATDGSSIALDVLVSRLAKAVQIAQYLAESTSAGEAYVWSNSAPSQMLWRKWQEYMEANSHRFDPQENFQKLNLANVNSVLQNGYTTAPVIKSDCIFNDETDAIFAATRAVQFLSQLLRRAEEGATDAAGRHMKGAPISTVSRVKTTPTSYTTALLGDGSFGLKTRCAFFTRGISTNSGHGQRKRVVVLGTGWSSFYFVKNLDLQKYDLQVVSPRNYFTFTPLLPKLLSGKISSVTCTEPFATYVNRRKRGNFQFVHARCLDVDPNAKTISCVSATDPNTTLSLPYDYLVVAVGAETNTFGIPGVDQHAYFLKEVEHANRIYQKIISNFEIASLPCTSEDEKRRLLHMVVVGGGPTGVETTGEIALLFNNMSQAFPSLVPYAKVTIVEGGKRLLATFSPANSEFAGNILGQRNVNLVLGKQVCGVGKDDCTVRDPATGATETLPCGLVVWASGLKQCEIVSKIREHFKEQNNPRALLVDQYLALRGSRDRSVFALGDCCKVSPDKLSDHYDNVLGVIGKPNHKALLRCRKTLGKSFPQLAPNKLNAGDRQFKDFCKKVERSTKSPKGKLLEIMDHIDANYVPPFPTAQNAKQEGSYLANAFNNGMCGLGSDAFNEVWRGSLASIGGKHVVGHFPLFRLNGGITTLLVWLSVYMMMFPSNKMRLCYMGNALIQKLYGRHLVSKQK